MSDLDCDAILREAQRLQTWLSGVQVSGDDLQLTHDESTWAVFTIAELVAELRRLREERTDLLRSLDELGYEGMVRQES